MNLAGTPPTRLPRSTSLVTTEPAAIVEPAPMLMPSKTVTLAPIQQSDSMVIGRANDVPLAALRSVEEV
jgi:hypothetical protein